MYPTHREQAQDGKAGIDPAPAAHTRPPKSSEPEKAAVPFIQATSPPTKKPSLDAEASQKMGAAVQLSDKPDAALTPVGCTPTTKSSGVIEASASGGDTSGLTERAAVLHNLVGSPPKKKSRVQAQLPKAVDEGGTPQPPMVLPSSLKLNPDRKLEAPKASGDAGKTPAKPAPLQIPGAASPTLKPDLPVEVLLAVRLPSPPAVLGSKSGSEIEITNCAEVNGSSQVKSARLPSPPLSTEREARVQEPAKGEDIPPQVGNISSPAFEKQLASSCQVQEGGGQVTVPTPHKTTMDIHQSGSAEISFSNPATACDNAAATSSVQVLPGLPKLPLAPRILPFMASFEIQQPHAGQSTLIN
jgi:hypothetical protein